MLVRSSLPRLIGSIGWMSVAEEPPVHLLPIGPLEGEVRCKFCTAMVRFGVTVKGNRAPFDLEDPHVNHWSTCEGRKNARQAFPRTSHHPQKPRSRP